MRDEEGGCRPLFQGISNVLKNEPKLRPCPFCGSAVTFGTGTYGECYINCMNHHYFFSTDEFRFAYGNDDKELVAREWNQRVGE